MKSLRQLFILSTTLLVIFFILTLYTLKFIWHPSYANSVFNHHATYVDNKTCLQCHQTQASDWLSSHHAMAMMIANENNVLGDFSNTTFKHHQVTSLFFKRDGKFFVKTEGADGKSAEFSIKYTIGVDPIQQYLIELPNGRIQNFTIAWDVKNKKWFHLYPNEKTPPGDVLHWTGRYQTANTMCISCHTTNFQKNYDPIKDSYNSTWSEGNVSCQSCHGPGNQHVQWATRKKSGNPMAVLSVKNKGLVVNLHSTNPETLTETCGTCHSRRNELTDHPQPGQPFMDNYLPMLMNEGLYFPDGQQQGEVYAYSSFTMSKMHQQGVSCVDCHQPHTGKLKLQGNAVCTQCHQPVANPRFPAAAGFYDSPAHHFHQMGTSGAQCISCHMPSKNFMIIHSRPDHHISIPNPDLSMQIGTPNACTNCHQDKSAQWASDWIKKWYGPKTPKSSYGKTISDARQGKDVETALIAIAQDSTQSPIVRATALSHLRNFNPQVNTALLKDKNPLLRYAAVSNLEGLDNAKRLQLIGPLLSDPIRAVRMEAALVLSSIPMTEWDTNNKLAFKIALQEFTDAQIHSIDMPHANLNLAVLNERLGNTEKAETYYLTALKIDPDFTPARLNLAQFYSKTNQAMKAEKILVDGIKRLPNQGDLYYSLGLLQAEMKRLPDAKIALEHASQFLPQQPRVKYNYALVLEQLGESKKAEIVFLQGLKLAPQHSEMMYALSLLYTQEQKWNQALSWAKKLAELNPDNPEIYQFVKDIEAHTHLPI